MFRYTDAVTKRLVDIDDDLLEKAKEILDADTIKETVNRSLGEVIAMRLRMEHFERLRTGAGTDIADDEVMSGAWR
jgi:Arc/MetJ family transcription regulator